MGLSSRHTEEETDRSGRTVEGTEGEEEQEAMVQGRKREKGDEEMGRSGEMDAPTCQGTDR